MWRDSNEAGTTTQYCARTRRELLSETVKPRGTTSSNDPTESLNIGLQDPISLIHTQVPLHICFGRAELNCQRFRMFIFSGTFPPVLLSYF